MDLLVQRLSKKAIELSGKSKKELERTCWMIVHEYKHGAMPTEYDIREIDEELYLEVLKTAREIDQAKKRKENYLLKMPLGCLKKKGNYFFNLTNFTILAKST